VTPDNKAAGSDLAEDYKPYHILSYANGPGMKILCTSPPSFFQWFAFCSTILLTGMIL
jgi:hypothetical protein